MASEQPVPTGAPVPLLVDEDDPDQIDASLADIQSKLASVQKELGGEGLSEVEIQKMLDTSSAAPPVPPPKLPEHPAERVAKAEEAKEEGNAKFKASDLKAAQKSYEWALKLVPSDWGAPTAEGKPDLGEPSKAVRLPVLLNLALVCLKMQPCEAYRCLELCEEALDIEPENVKATYRKGKALTEMGSDYFKEADYELVKACKLAPKDVAIRKDLEQLRRRVREQKESEKQTYERIVSKDMKLSEGRQDATAAKEAAARDAGSYAFLTEPEKNPYRDEPKPAQRALELQRSGRLEEAVTAWEAGVFKSAEAGEWDVHFACWLDLARLFMDLNNDMLALRCLNRITEKKDMPVAATLADVMGGSLVLRIRQHALLLRSICLLNEAEGDLQIEIGACLQRWLALLGVAKEGDVIDEVLEKYKRESGTPDSAIALGLLLLVRGGEGTLQAFVDAVPATGDHTCCFGPERIATRWNMLGAVLANRGRGEHALVAYEQALAAQPHFPRALSNRAIALVARSDYTGAAAAYAKSLTMTPEWLAPTVWAPLHKAAGEAGVDGLIEAVEQKHVAKCLELLEAQLPKEVKAGDVGAILKQLKLQE